MKRKQSTRQKRNSLVVCSSTPYFTKRGQLPKISREPSPQPSPPPKKPSIPHIPFPTTRQSDSYLTQIRIIKQQARHQAQHLRERQRQQQLTSYENVNASRQGHKTNMMRVTSELLRQRKMDYERYRHVCDKRCPEDCKRRGEMERGMGEGDGEEQKIEEDQVRFASKYDSLKEELMPFRNGAVLKEQPVVRGTILADMMEFDSLAKRIHQAVGEERVNELAKNDHSFLTAVKRSIRGLKAFPQVRQAIKRDIQSSPSNSPNHFSSRYSHIVTKILTNAFRQSLNFSGTPSYFSKQSTRAPSTIGKLSKFSSSGRPSAQLLQDIAVEEQLSERARQQKKSLRNRSNSNQNGQRRTIGSVVGGGSSKVSPRNSRISKFGVLFKKKTSHPKYDMQNTTLKSNRQRRYGRKRIRRIISDLNTFSVRNQIFPGSHLIKKSYFDFISEESSQEEDDVQLDQEVLFAGQYAQYYREKVQRLLIPPEKTSQNQSPRLKLITIQPEQTLAEIKHSLLQLFCKKGLLKNLRKYRRYFIRCEKQLKEKTERSTLAFEDALDIPDNDFSWCHKIDHGVEVFDTLTLKIQLSHMQRQFQQAQPLQKNIEYECDSAQFQLPIDEKQIVRMQRFQEQSKLISDLMTQQSSDKLHQRELFKTSERMAWNSRKRRRAK